MHLASFIDVLADVSQVVGLTAAAVALALTYWQIRSATAAAKTSAVLALDEAFARFEDLRNELRDASEEQPYMATSAADRAKLSRYLVVFERLGLLVREGLIDERLARDEYGYALSRVMERSNAREIIAEELEEVQDDKRHSERRWENLLRLCRALPVNAMPGGTPRPPG